MLKTTVALMSLAFSLSSFAWPGGSFGKLYRGKMQQEVTISYADDIVEAKTFKTKCRGNTNYKHKNEYYNYSSAYNCRGNKSTDGNLRLKEVDGALYETNYRGDVNSDDAVGVPLENGMDVQFSATRKMMVPQFKLDEKGCPTREMKREEVELSRSLNLNVEQNGDELVVVRETSTQRVVPVRIKLENCDRPFYNKHVISTFHSVIQGTLEKH